MGYEHQSSLVARLFAFWGFGFLCIIASGVFGGFYHLISKRVTSADAEDPLPLLYVVLIRQLVMMLTSLPLAAHNKASFRSIPLKTWIILVLRALFAFFGIAAQQFAIQYLTLSDMATIMAITPLVSSLATWPIFKERPKYTDIPIFICCIVGVVFIVQPGFLFSHTENYSPPSIVGILATLLAVACFVGIFLSFRGLVSVPASSINLVYGTLTFAISLIVNAIFVQRLPPCSYLLRFETVAIGFLAFCSVYSATTASKSVPPSFVALGSISELIFHLIWQAVVFQNVPKLFSLVGALIVIASFTFYGFRSYLVHRHAGRDLNTMPQWLRIMTN